MTTGGRRAQHTCKLTVAVAPVTELGDQFAVELEDENAAGLVVHHDDVAISVHRDALRAHQLARADLVLEEVDRERCYITPLARIGGKRSPRAEFRPTAAVTSGLLNTASAPREVNRRRSRKTEVRRESEGVTSTTNLKLPLAGEDADPFVVVVGDDDVAVGVHCDTRRSLQLTGRPAPHTEPALEQTVVGENLSR